MVRVSNEFEAASGRARGRRPVVTAAALPALALVAALGFAGAVAGSDGLRRALMERSGATTTAEALRAVAWAPFHLLRATANGVAPPRLSIDIKFKYLHRLHETRNAALRSGVLSVSADDLVPASVDVEGRTVPVALRLTGDRTDLLEGEKWPLRIEVRGDGHVFGMRRFDLMPPELRGFQLEHLFLEHLEREGVLAPRFVFVDVRVNGKGLGLMALGESFAEELLVRQQRRDGPMLRMVNPPDGTGPAGASEIAPLRPRHIARSRKLSRGLKTATGLMQAALAGSLRAGDVFDPDLTGRFLAVAELWGAQHALGWRNLRFYFNPLTAKLEPIGHAAELQHPHLGEGELTRAAPFATRLLEDPRISAAFTRSLHRIAGEMLEESFAAAMREQQTEPLRLLHREYPLRVPFAAEPLRRRAARLQRFEAARAPAAGPLEGAPPMSGPAPPLAPRTLAETLARHPFLSWDEAAHELRAAPGRWDVQGSLIPPKGAGLTLPAGTILHFEPRHGLIARGPLTFAGEAAAPVVLEGPPGAKPSQLWSGVYVVESARPSRWSHVVVRNTGGFQRNGWQLAGGVVFRKAPVAFDRCTFAGNRGDDALNVVRSTFSLRDVTILDSQSDAFDADFAEGSIVGGTIARAGGDGIDLGGSRADLRGTRLANIRDKAISVGERSFLSARNIEIERAGVGVASKNGSQAEIADSTFRDIADVALLAYTNRPEFGPGSLTAENNRIARTALPALAQTGSRVLLDGEVLAPVDAAVERLYKDGEGEP
jgi:hypothetical protein